MARFRPGQMRHPAAIAFAAAIVLCAAPAFAHVGSPDVFYEGNAGPYHLFVTVMVPQVIPGVADVQIRTDSDDVRKISTAVTRLSGPGSQYAPVPDVAVRSPVDPHLFTSSLWLMEYGSLRVLLKVSGTHGDAEMSVPVASFARRNLAMPKWLGAILLVLAAGLALGAISIIGAAAREARLAPGVGVSHAAVRTGRIAMMVTMAIVAAIFYFAFEWWDSDARNYARIATLFKPPPITLTFDGPDRLRIQAADSPWAKYKVMDTLIPDHGHLMHLFLVRTPAFDRFWHLHPVHNADGSFDLQLPPLDAGHYDVFADVVDQSGFPWTLVGAIDLLRTRGGSLTSDDSGGSFVSINGATKESTDTLADGTRVVWQHGALQANTPMILHFSVQNPSSAPATDLEPYMGMVAHVEIVKSDLSVFAHIHPSGSVPMASLMLASNDAVKGGAMSMPGMVMPDGSKMQMAEKLSPELSMPYGFPNPGLYRIFVQFKRAGKIETAVFDAQVR
ncbi:MAG TPA: hypothetical protein VJX23_12575 [Candidatus Binataceae bacterium]|nr:hypothetical protein [Candidatus Binataceae bacterium]